MPDLWTDLLARLDIASDADAGMFEGRNQQMEYYRVLGGQLLAQFIRIASLTCPDEAVTSQHAVFAREGRADEPIVVPSAVPHRRLVTAVPAHSVLAHGRCFGRGDVLTEDGSLTASYGQEARLRFPNTDEN